MLTGSAAFGSAPIRMPSTAPFAPIEPPELSAVVSDGSDVQSICTVFGRTSSGSTSPATSTTNVKLRLSPGATP